ncbi:STAS domain-containing protein [Paracoccus pacificus]|uniref:Anti-sigma factor antagonist n=1 Tax=Paracoccus pacificus TaxID=1463598 RepID=A0ABW4R6X2_9RHOB
MNLTITESDDNRTVIQLADARLDAAIATRFKDKMRAVTGSRHGAVILDMSCVDFMDSSGLGAIIAARKNMPDGADLQIAGLTQNVARVFKLTKMDTIFTIHDTIAPGPAE